MVQEGGQILNELLKRILNNILKILVDLFYKNKILNKKIFFVNFIKLN